MKFEGETDAEIVSETPVKRAPRKRRATLKAITSPTITPAEASKFQKDFEAKLEENRKVASDFLVNAQKFQQAAQKNPFGALMSVLVEVAAKKRKQK